VKLSGADDSAFSAKVGTAGRFFNLLAKIF